jgi:predicted CXXCH cytochrome family protein
MICAAALVANAQVTTVVGSPHDFSAEGGAPTVQVCVFCHTPHQTLAANAQDPLWNHELTTTSPFGTYQSTTMDHTANEIGGAAAGAASSSLLCMSCHDGTIAVNNLWNDPNDQANPTVDGSGSWDTNADSMIDTTHSAYIGTSLTDDHPINFTYNAALDTENELRDPPTNADVLRGGEVQCSSCHNPHKSVDNYGFLRYTMNNSDLCINCHVK